MVDLGICDDGEARSNEKTAKLDHGEVGKQVPTCEKREKKVQVWGHPEHERQAILNGKRVILIDFIMRKLDPKRSNQNFPVGSIWFGTNMCVFQKTWSHGVTANHDHE